MKVMWSMRLLRLGAFNYPYASSYDERRITPQPGPEHQFTTPLQLLDFVSNWI